MFYEPAKRDRGLLPHDPFKALVTPRPIGWISTLGRDGVANLAPFSFFNAVASDPPMVMFASGGAAQVDGRKDSHRNAEESGEFVANIVPYRLKDAMSASSATMPPEVDEFEAVGLAKLPSVLVRPPRVAGAPAHLECRTERVIHLPARTQAPPNVVVFGLVVGVHIDESVIVDGRVDVRRFRPVARLGYFDYTSVEDVFAMDFPP
ncbi:MAG: flavin reductase family protein [Alphaproteobacteria bacterium]